MNAQNVDEILAVLAAKFGTTAEHLWGVLVRQAYVESITAILFAITCGVATWLLVRTGNTEREKHIMHQKWPPEMAYVGAFVLACMGVLVALSSGAYFVNPEYFALTKVLGAIR